jgi:hypothetical protein
MSNPISQVAMTFSNWTESQMRYWPINPSLTSDVYYTGEALGMLASSGYCYHFDDSAPMVYLGNKSGDTHRLTSDTPAYDYKEMPRWERFVEFPVTSATSALSIPLNVGDPAFMADSGHVQLNQTGLTYSNYMGMVVNVARQGSAGPGVGGITSLTGSGTPASVQVAPVQPGALLGLQVQCFPGPGSSGASAKPVFIIGENGAPSSGVTAAGQGTTVTVTLGSGGAAAGSGTGGAGGQFVIQGGSAGTSGSGTAGTIGGVVYKVTVSSPLATSQTVASSGTITLPTAGINQLVSAASAVTGVILVPGRLDGEEVRLINTSANTITFAAAATSNVALGTGSVVPANGHLRLIWSSANSKWY